MIEDPRGEYQYTCPKCNECDASRVANETEEEWVGNYWVCNSCEFEWREHFTFTHWDTD